MKLLKQSTAFTFRIGPFVDDTDGKTAETGLSIGQADIQISKNGGAFAQTSASPTTTHDADGWYQCPLTTTDTGTLGTLTVQILMTGALPVWEHFMVVPANVYDSLVAGSDNMQVDTIQWLGTACATPTTNGVPEVDITHIAGSAVSTSTAQLGVNVVQAAGTAWASGAITAASIATDAIDADAIADNAINATAIATGAITNAKFAAGAIDAAAIANDAIDSATLASDVTARIATAVWNAATSSYGGAGTYGQAVEDVLDDTGTAGVVVASLAAGSVNAAAIANGAIDAATFAAGAIDATAIADNAIDFATFAADCKTGTGLKANVESISANAITATSIAADAGTEIATAVWAATNATISQTYADIASRIYRFLMNKMNITDATGAVALRNEADGANIATQTISDDDTTTVRTALSWS